MPDVEDVLKRHARRLDGVTARRGKRYGSQQSHESAPSGQDGASRTESPSLRLNSHGTSCLPTHCLNAARVPDVTGLPAQAAAGASVAHRETRWSYAEAGSFRGIVGCAAPSGSDAGLKAPNGRTGRCFAVALAP